VPPAIATAIFLFGCKQTSGPPQHRFWLGDLHGTVALVDPGLYSRGQTIACFGLDEARNEAQRLSLMVVEIAGLPTGTYTLTFSKSGFGTQKRFGFEYVAEHQHRTAKRTLPTSHDSTSTPSPRPWT